MYMLSWNIFMKINCKSLHKYERTRWMSETINNFGSCIKKSWFLIVITASSWVINIPVLSSMATASKNHPYTKFKHISRIPNQPKHHSKLKLRFFVRIYHFNKYTNHRACVLKKKQRLTKQKIIPGVTRFKVGSGVREGGDWFARSGG